MPRLYHRQIWVQSFTLTRCYKGMLRVTIAEGHLQWSFKKLLFSVFRFLPPFYQPPSVKQERKKGQWVEGSQTPLTFLSQLGQGVILGPYTKLCQLQMQLAGSSMPLHSKAFLSVCLLQIAATLSLVSVSPNCGTPTLNATQNTSQSLSQLHIYTPESQTTLLCASCERLLTAGKDHTPHVTIGIDKQAQIQFHTWN